MPFQNPDIEKEAFYENEYFFAVFDIFPVSPGHTIIIPKKQLVDFRELDENTWAQLRTTIQEVIIKIEQTDLKKIYQTIIANTKNENVIKFCNDMLHHPRINSKPDAYNQGINDGEAAGRTVKRLHWHIIPRFKNDVLDPTGGIRYVIPDKGNYKKSRK